MVTEVRAPSKYVIEIVTDCPNPIMHNNLTNMSMLDKGWGRGEQRWQNCETMKSAKTRLRPKTPTAQSVII